MLRCRAIIRQTKWSAPKLTNFEIDVGPSSGTLMKPKNHSMGVGGLLVRELEREKDLKAEKDWFLGQNQVFHFDHYFLLVKDRENPSTPPCRGIHTQYFKPLFTSESGHQGARYRNRRKPCLPHFDCDGYRTEQLWW